MRPAVAFACLIALVLGVALAADAAGNTVRGRLRRTLPDAEDEVPNWQTELAAAPDEEEEDTAFLEENEQEEDDDALGDEDDAESDEELAADMEEEDEVLLDTEERSSAPTATAATATPAAPPVAPAAAAPTAGGEPAKPEEAEPTDLKGKLLRKAKHLKDKLVAKGEAALAVVVQKGAASALRNIEKANTILDLIKFDRKNPEIQQGYLTNARTKIQWAARKMRAIRFASWDYWDELAARKDLGVPETQAALRKVKWRYRKKLVKVKSALMWKKAKNQIIAITD